MLPPFKFPKLLWENTVNVNPSILSFYTHAIVPRITRQTTLALASRKRAQGVVGDGEYEDDGNYGSTATLDVEILQAISKRVHYGQYKFCTLLLMLTIRCCDIRKVRVGIKVSREPCSVHTSHFEPEPR